MLSPRKSRVILLPEDRKLIDLLGWDESQYRYFVRQASTFNDIRPGEPTAFFVLPFLAKLVIGLALSYLASVLARRQNSKPAQLETRQIDGQNIVTSGRFAPRAGFDSAQNVVELGSVIPVVFAKREQIGGVWYGGVRINTNLLWSQLYSQGTGQLLRAVFMVSEGPIGALDPRQFAIGDNLLGSYDLETAGNTAGRCSVYFRSGGGLIRSTDHIAGRLPANDDGNAENSGGASVFDVRGINQAYSNDFCYASKPSNQTAFGLYATIGNGLSYRPNPVIRPAVSTQLKPVGGNSTSSYVSCNKEAQISAEREKQENNFASRSGVIKFNNALTSVDQSASLTVGDTFSYLLSPSSDYNKVFVSRAPGPDGKARCIDIAQTVAARQAQWDDSIVVGELYKIGTALAICVSRTPDGEIFVSEADSEPKGAGQSIEAVFRVVKAGIVVSPGDDIYERSKTVCRNGTNYPHLHRVAISTFVVDRPTQIIEIGYKSTLGLRYNGLCNFRDAESLEEVDGQACYNYEGNRISSGQDFVTKNITSGTVGVPAKRYSFFRIGCRIAGSDEDFTELNINFGFASQTQQAAYNYIRLQFPSAQRWEIQHIPLSGWEIRQNVYPHPLIVLDSRAANLKTGSSNGFVFNYSGETVSLSSSTFGMPPTIPTVPGQDLGIGWQDSDKSYVDAYGALAETFPYEEIQSSAGQPEHEIAYVNLVSSNPAIPTYENIATVGLTIRSGPSVPQLNQFSVYVNSGFGDTHLFPEVYGIALTNDLFGAGDIVSPVEIDFDSFDYSSTWTYNNRYFFDQGISEPFNLRSRGAELAQLFLLDLSTKNGKFHLSPIAEFGVQYAPTALFTSGNANSINVTQRDSQERQPIRVSVRWREERQSSDLSGRGLFPIIREVTVREAGVSDLATLVQIDMSEFCTSEIHAVDAAKMRCRQQRLSTHDATIECLPDRNALEPGAIVKLGMEILAYEQPNNGIILADGSATVTSGLPLADGSYDVVLWDGTGELEEVSIDVVGGKVASYSNAVFCIADSVQATQTFKVQVISYNDEGNLEITVSHFPLDENGYSLLTKDWNTQDAWIIEGLIGELPPDVPLDPPFAGVNIIGPLSVVKDSQHVYIAEVDGPNTAYTYLWTATNATFDNNTLQSPTVTFTGSGSAVLGVTVTRVSDSLARVATANIVIAAPTGNSISITGPTSRIGDGTVALSAVIAAPFTTATYEWSLVGQGTLSSLAGSSTTLTVSSANTSTRIVSLFATIDGIDYIAEHFVNVFSATPLVISGPTAIGLGSAAYNAVLSGDLPESGWTFSWTATGP